jgi:hypothetical protein
MPSINPPTIVGLAAEAKPTMVNPANQMPMGAQYLEIDTGNRYYYNSQTSAWISLPASSAALGPVAGDVASDSPDSGNPVKIGFRASSAQPTQVQAGDRVDAWATLSGRLTVTGLTTSTVNDASVGLNSVTNNEGSGVPGVANMLFDGATFARQRGNVESTLLASAARTATVSTADQTNHNGQGLIVVLDVTVPGTGSVTLSIEGKDPTSGKYYTILAGVAVTTAVTVVYRVWPGLTAVANATANDRLPKTYRVTVTHNNANSISYSVGSILLM